MKEYIKPSIEIVSFDTEAIMLESGIPTTKIGENDAVDAGVLVYNSTW